MATMTPLEQEHALIEMRGFLRLMTELDNIWGWAGFPQQQAERLKQQSESLLEAHRLQLVEVTQ